ncbi:MAG: autotransporter-associated beta strand repeat-containing protein, partial [Verrucomicrobium sp.]
LLKDGIGTVTLRGTNTFTGSVTASAGRLILDYSSGNLVLPTNRELTFNGGTLEVTNAGGAVTLGNLTMTGNSGLNKLVVGASTNLTVGNTWTRNSTTVMLIDLSAAGSVLTASPTTSESKTIATGTTASLVTGSNFAAYTVKDASGRYDFAAVSGGTIGRLNATLALPTTTGGSASNAYLLKPTEGSTNLQFNAGATVTGGVLRVETTSSAGSLDVNGGKLVLDDLGFLVDGANDFTINDSSVAKTGTVEGGSGNPALFIYHYGTGKLTINAKLSTGAGSLAFIGEGGLVDWNSAANIAGATNIEGAVLRVSNAAAMTLDNATITGNGSGYLNISNGGILELTTQDFTRSLSVITGTLGGRFGFVAGDGGGFSAFGADRFVDIKASTTGAVSASIVWGSTAGFLNTGAKLILGSKYADHILDFKNNLDLNNGNQVVDVQSTNVAGRGGKLSGVLSSTNGAIQKIGQGILEVTGDNTYGGGTVVKEGTFLANNIAGSATGTGNVTVLSGARLGGNGSVGKSGTLQNIEVRSGGTLSVGQLGNTSGQQLKLITSGSGVITLAGTVEFDLFGNNGGVNLSGNNDQLSLTSNTAIALGGTLKINDLTDVATELTLGSSWQLIDWALVAVNSGPKFTGNFTTFDVPILADGLAWDYSQLYTTGYVSIGVVPEPGRILLLSLGVAALTLRRRRKQS